jgi:16S rRNA (cytidine1402-2'-O)-methyltransferase
MTAGVLYIVGTPIGNLGDITLRALETLKIVDVIAAEDTRITARLLERYQVQTPTVSFREENAAQAIPALIARLNGGQNIALVSDAGTPSVSDPGQQLAEAAHATGVRVCPIPGPSALASAVSACGLTGDGIRFHGFLPRSGKERASRLEAIATDTALSVIYESPHRTGATLSDLAARCGNRRAAMMRELTKLHEEVRIDDLPRLAAAFAENVRGEVTIVVEGTRDAADQMLSEASMEELVRREIERGESAKDISARLSQTLGVKKKEVYDLVLRILRGGDV